MKYYFFKDKESKISNLSSIPYQAAGLVDSVHCEMDSPNYNRKDIVVYYFKPYDGLVVKEWRALNEVELFEANEYRHKVLLESYKVIRDAVDRMEY